MNASQKQKREIRERIWSLLDQETVAEPGSRGYIPNFYGSRQAAAQLTRVSAWQNSQIIKCVPDRAQLPVRALALEAGKIVYMASPRLAEMPPFYLLDPASVEPGQEWNAAERNTVARAAKKIDFHEMQAIDIAVLGSVAVGKNGSRVGKGAGYSDLELALLTEHSILTRESIVVTTVHDLQVVDDEVIEEKHDFRVDYIATPTRLISCNASRRPTGIIWASLDEEKIEAIPVLEGMRK